jgi:2-C-methyl-D-erythritol 2,4-cyclodiphosphate synthase
MKIGHGYDVHRLVSGRRLVLGGVEIEHHKGLLGHSDADVVLHSICDAVLGALGLGDIGQHFPDNDEKYRGIDSRKLLREVVTRMTAREYQLSNIDVSIIAQSPKLASYLPLMKKLIAEDFNSDPSAVNLKATTTESLGFVGREEGIASHAVVLLQPTNP